MHTGSLDLAGLDAEERATLLSAQRAARLDLAGEVGATFNLATAENVLLYDRLRPVLTDFAKFDIRDTKYPGRVGGTLEELHNNTAAFLTVQYRLQAKPLLPNHVLGVSGVSAALESLAFALCDPGDTVIIPAPCWQGFKWCFTYRARAELVPFAVSSSEADPFRLTLDDVKKAYEGVSPRPKVLVLTNPDNPLGVTYSKDLLEEIYGWAMASTEMHVISDEIYFHSETADKPEFTTAFALDAYRPDRVHVVWGFAKDFGVSGFRAGFVLTRDKDVMERIIARRMWFLAPFASPQIFMLSQGVLSRAGGFARELMVLYRRRLIVQRGETAKALGREKIAYYTHGTAAQFFWLDLSKYLDRVPPGDEDDVSPADATDEREKRLDKYLRDRGIFLLPGGELSCPVPGWFRLCFTCEQLRVMEAAVAELGKVLRGLSSLPAP